MNTDWNEVFKRRPDLRPLGYEEAVEQAKQVTEQRYRLNGRKRAKGSNTRSAVKESRQATDARRAKYPSLKHGSQG